MQVSPEEMRIREIAMEYLSVQNNTQLISHLKCFQFKKSRIVLQPEKMHFNIEHLLKIMVQLTYFVYSCHLQKITAIISLQMYCLLNKQQHKAHQVYLEYLLQKDYQQRNAIEQQYLQQHFKPCQTHKTSSAFAQCVVLHLERYLSLAKKILQGQKQQRNEHLLQYVLKLEEIIMGFIIPNVKKVISPRVLMLCLEESALFRQYSTLLKTMNNSLFAAIRFSLNQNKIFKEILCVEEEMIKWIGCFEGGLKNRSQRIEECIQELMRVLIKEGIVTAETSVNHQDANMTNQKKYSFGVVKGSHIQDRVYSIKILLLERQFLTFNQQLFHKIIHKVTEETNKHTFTFNANKKYDNQPKSPSLSHIDSIVQGKSKNNFSIEYISATNIIIVRYVTDIQLNSENTDYLMVQCNNSTFQNNLVAVELFLNSQNQISRRQRKLTFKSIVKLNEKERPLLKIMLLFDLLTIYAKTYESQIRKNNLFEGKNNLSKIHQKISHLLKIHIKKIEKMYKVFGENAKLMNS